MFPLSTSLSTCFRMLYMQFKITMRGLAHGIILPPSGSVRFSGSYEPNWWPFLPLEASRLWSANLKDCILGS